MLQYTHRLPRIFFALVEQAVDDLAVVNARILCQGAADLPALVRRDDFFASVCVENVQLGRRGHAVAEVVVLQFQAEGAHVPALAAGNGQAVLALLQCIDRIRDDLQSLLIVVEIRGQELVPDLFAVQGCLKQAGAADIEPRTGNGPIHGKALNEFRMEGVFLRRRDPFAQERLAHFAGLEEGASRSGLAVVSRHGDPDVISRARLAGKIQDRAAAVGALRAQKYFGEVLLPADLDECLLTVFCLRVRHLPGDIDRIQCESDRFLDSVDFDLFNLHTVTPCYIFCCFAAVFLFVIRIVFTEKSG